MWVSPEIHGNLSAAFKNQIDWMPLSEGAIRPTQGKTVAVMQVEAGSQSFNTVNNLRVLGRCAMDALHRGAKSELHPPSVQR